jgi:hypothetical protein
VKVLIRWGADTRLKNNQKKTPLDLAEKRDKTLVDSMKNWVVQYGMFHFFNEASGVFGGGFHFRLHWQTLFSRPFFGDVTLFNQRSPTVR